MTNFEQLPKGISSQWLDAKLLARAVCDFKHRSLDCASR